MSRSNNQIEQPVRWGNPLTNWFKNFERDILKANKTINIPVHIAREDCYDDVVVEDHSYGDHRGTVKVYHAYCAVCGTDLPDYFDLVEEPDA